MPSYDTTRVASVRFFRLCGLVLGCVLALSEPSIAQAAEPEASDVPPHPTLGPVNTNPAISLDDLAHRLVPLTKDELAPLARDWLKIVKIKTEEIAERQVELLHDPSAATDEAYQIIVSTVEERASLLERFTMVVDALQSKGGDDALVTELRAYRDSVLFSETKLASPSHRHRFLHLADAC
jgi:small conductance mechanosensitive channel